MLRSRPLTGRVVVVTGATSGACRAAAEAFARHGCRLVLAARSAPALEEVATACRAAGAEVVVVPTDVGDPAAVRHLRAVAVGRFARIDVWVEGAAVVIVGPLGSERPQEAQRLIDTVIGGAVNGSREALEQFRRQGEGVLVNVSSILGVTPNPLVPLYVMGKYAIVGLTRALQVGNPGRRGVHACLILPGPIDTPLFDRAANHTGWQPRAVPPACAPERVAAAIVSAARRPRRTIPVGAMGRLVLLGLHVVPRFTQWAVARYSAATLLRHEHVPDGANALFDPPAHGTVDGGWRRMGWRRRAGAWYGRALADRGARRRSRAGRGDPGVGARRTRPQHEEDPTWTPTTAMRAPAASTRNGAATTPAGGSRS